MEEAAPHFENMKELIKSATNFKQQLKMEESRRYDQIHCTEKQLWNALFTILLIFILFLLQRKKGVFSL